ncbi:fucose permease [Klebsiella oxytoca]|nr:fucose permease [Klebsiella oxytoca]
MGNTTIQTQSFHAVETGQSKRYIIPFALLCSLFFLWAVANNLNDILLPQFQQAFTLTNFQAGLIQSAFYFGYFVIPIPAGILMKKLSYKAGIITGLFLYAFGAALFWPAAEVMNYTLFLIGLFIIAAGLGCLETAANPFVTVLGPESGGHFRLNLAQTFNSFGAIIAVVFGQSLILSNVPHQSQDVLDKMAPEQLSAYKHSLVLSVQTPYMIIVAVVLLVALLIMLTKFPALQSDDHSDANQSSFSASLARLVRVSPLALGGAGAVLLRRRTNRLLELSDSLRHRRDPRHDARFRRQLSDWHYGVLLYRPFLRHLAHQPLRAA